MLPYTWCDPWHTGARSIALTLSQHLCGNIKHHPESQHLEFLPAWKLLFKKSISLLHFFSFVKWDLLLKSPSECMHALEIIQPKSCINSQRLKGKQLGKMDPSSCHSVSNIAGAICFVLTQQSVNVHGLDVAIWSLAWCGAVYWIMGCETGHITSVWACLFCWHSLYNTSQPITISSMYQLTQTHTDYSACHWIVEMQVHEMANMHVWIPRINDKTATTSNMHTVVH